MLQKTKFTRLLFFLFWFIVAVTSRVTISKGTKTSQSLQTERIIINPLINQLIRLLFFKEVSPEIVTLR